MPGLPRIGRKPAKVQSRTRSGSTPSNSENRPMVVPGFERNRPGQFSRCWVAS